MVGGGEGRRGVRGLVLRDCALEAAVADVAPRADGVCTASVVGGEGQTSEGL